MDHGCVCTLKKDGIRLAPGQLRSLENLEETYYFTINPADPATRIVVGGAFPFMVNGGEDAPVIKLVCAPGQFVMAHYVQK